MSFKKYSSIDEKSRKLALDKYVTRGYTTQDWVVTTKIHGANFSIFVTEGSMRFARRTGWLEDGEKFYGYEKVRDRHLFKFMDIRTAVLERFGLDKTHNVQIYGELFGGHYPHPDVERVKDVSKVQDKVWYCPDVDFFPFDIYVRKGDAGIEGSVHFPLDHDVFEEIVEPLGFTAYAKALFTGSFQECLDYPNDYPDPIHKLYGLPELEDNICEGNVLKPLKACCEPSGSRVILKTKNERFTERKRVPKERKPIVVSDEAQRVVQVADEYITENRLRNVVSHFGEVTDRDFGKVMGAFAQDVRKDMEGDDPEIFDKIEKDEVKRVNKTINNACASFMKKHFVNIIDGVF
jgi:Rnl2 family RNA ligase